MPMAPGPGTTWTPPASPCATCSSICLPARAAGPLMADRDKPPKIPAAGALLWRPSGEVDERAWRRLTAAGDRLPYQHDTEVLAEFAAAPAATRAIILVRHASARNKKTWQNAGHPDDLTRPLTPLGHVQAKLLGQILSCFGPARVISSPAERCLATVEPYAAMTGGVVEPAPALAPPPGDQVLEEADPATVAAAHELVTGLVT